MVRCTVAGVRGWESGVGVRARVEFVCVYVCERQVGAARGVWGA